MIPTARATTLAVAISTALLLSGCADTAPSETSASGDSATLNKTLIYSPAALAIPTLKDQADLVTSIAEDDGWKTTVVDPNFDSVAQVQQIEQAINSGQAGAVWVIPVDAKALSGVIELAQSKGIAMALTGSPSDFGFDGPQPGLVFGSTDGEKYGSTIADEVAACIDEELDGTASAFIVTQSGGQSGAEQQMKGILDTFAEASPDSEIVATEYADTRVDAQTKVSQLLQAHPDVNAVIATSDEDALGAIGAFEAAGRQLPCIVGGGGGPEAREAVTSGQMYSLVAFDYSTDAKNIFGYLADLAEDPSADGELGSVPITVVAD